MTFDTLLTNATVATMDDAGYGLIKNASIGINDGIISYVGPDDGSASAQHSRDLAGKLVTPALIDCHTHLLFGGDRISEFEQRLGGATYEELSAAGGGIVSTVSATRRSSDDELTQGALTRLRWLLENGTGTVEIKSGYGLTTEHELRMLRLARQVSEQTPVRITTSLLAAHAIPPETDPDDYITQVCHEIIPQAASEGLADCVDAFLETIAFTPTQIRRVFDAAVDAGLPVRLHADQLSDGGGAALAAEYGALSADHLEHASEAGIAAMAEAGTVGVVIPGASVFLNEATRPPITAMRRHGLATAVSTDLNPGTSPLASLQAAMWLAAAKFRMTPAETLAGTTRHAAAALGLSDTGIISVGMRADVTLWDATDPAALTYWSGAPLCQTVWLEGIPVFDRSAP